MKYRAPHSIILGGAAWATHHAEIAGQLAYKYAPAELAPALQVLVDCFPEASIGLFGIHLAYISLHGLHFCLGKALIAIDEAAAWTDRRLIATKQYALQAVRRKLDDWEASSSG